MKRILSLLAGMLMSICLVCPLVVAQTTGFTYQGSLNTGGTPANGNHDFEFALFDLLSSGTQLGSTLTRSNIVVTNGVFSVSLDFGNQFPGANRFLEIRVRPSGGGAFTPLAPRQQINSSPYSVASLNANQLGGIAANQYLTSGAAVINAGTQFNIGGQRVLSAQGTNTFVGAGTGTTGTSNTFVGTNAGLSNAAGTANSFFGASAGQDNAGGIDNSFFGVNTGRGNTSGSRNSFFGRLAGRFNSVGTDNTFMGYNAGALNGAGVFNTAVGAQAGENTTGNQNAFFGGLAGAANSTGSHNSFFGEGAGIANQTAGSNSFFGRRSGDSNTIGNNNSFFGIFSGDGNITGNRNVFIGANAGHGNVDGDFNTIVGADANVGGVNLTNATAIGRLAQVNTSNSLVLGSLSPATNVGIGTSAPTHRLTIGQPETPVISSALTAVYGSGSAFSIVRDTTNNVEGVFGADSSGVIIGAMTNHTVQFRVNNADRLRIFTDGDVVVGDVGTDVTFGVQGFIGLTHLGSSGNVSLCYNSTTDRLSTCSSSQRYKTQISDFSDGLKVLDRLRPVTFNWKTDGMPDLGLVAEEVAAVEPLLTTTNEKGQVEGVKYDRVGVVLVNAVKEQQAQIESQSEIIKRQQQQIDALTKLVCATNPSAQICATEIRKEK